MPKNISCTRRKGATLVLVALVTVLLVGMVAFAVEVGRMYLVRAQLQTAVDAGSLAAALHLQRDRLDIDGAVDAANEFVQANRVGWLVTVPEDAIVVETGTWDADSREFSPAGLDVNAVRVGADQAGEPLMFAAIFGHTSFTVPATAIATAGGLPMDIMLTLDLSGSMGQEGRIEALQNAAPLFVGAIKQVGDNDQIGVMGYGAIAGQYDPLDEGHFGTPYLLAPPTLYPPDDQWVGVLESPLTEDFDRLINSVLNAQTLTAGKYNGWTPVGAAIRDSTHYLSNNARDRTEKIMVLMSDGHANRPEGNGPGYARSMAAYAKANDITIYTISLGNAADDGLMQDIADATGGQFFKAAGNTAAVLEAELKKAFQHIASSLKRTQLVQ